MGPDKPHPSLSWLWTTVSLCLKASWRQQLPGEDQQMRYLVNSSQVKTSQIVLNLTFQSSTQLGLTSSPQSPITPSKLLGLLSTRFIIRLRSEIMRQLSRARERWKEVSYGDGVANLRTRRSGFQTRQPCTLRSWTVSWSKVITDMNFAKLIWSIIYWVLASRSS